MTVLIAIFLLWLATILVGAWITERMEADDANDPFEEATSVRGRAGRD